MGETGFPAYRQLGVEVAGPVATVTITNGERNSWSEIMNAELHDVVRRLDGRDDVRAVVITGAGRVFSTGYDLSGGRIGGGDRELAPGVDDTPFTPDRARKPVIAALNGDAVGGGTTFPLLCDIRYVAAGAKLAFPFVRRGIATEYGASWLTPRLVGLPTALDLVLTGRTFSAEEAVERGLCHRLLPAEEVLPEAHRLAAEIAERTSPEAVAVVKRLLWDGLERTFDAAVEVERAWFSWTLGRPDATEGVRSFMEKRPPAWVGRPSEVPADPP
ncbi:MAG: enoyl-CoA hydratase/isomerase family protein [Acidimicrobiia bacterium]